MLVVSPFRSSKDGRDGETESFLAGGDDFSDFSDENLLYSIDFDDLFVDIDDGDELPDLEMDPEMLAEFSASGGEESVTNGSVSAEKVDSSRKEEEDKVSAGSDFGSGSSFSQGDEIVSKREEFAAGANPSPKQADKGRKSSAQSKNLQGKRKVKVDWTPELHRRFVQAVEQLGVDKAVPSRILELMGIDCLTRHNIASHLQKYRSHRKHLQAREAEAASWSQRRQMHGGAAAGGGSNNMTSPLQLAPTMGFPPMTVPFQHFRPLHVWGHPSADQSVMHTWPKHLVRPPLAVAAAWAPTPHPPPRPQQGPPFWHSHPQRVLPNSITPGTPYFPPPLATTRFPAPPLVAGFPPHPMYGVDPSVGFPTKQARPHPPSDFHPSNESIDSAIGDVLLKPWLPLPLGLKPPSLDGVLVELQRQGVRKIPPSCG